MNVRHRQPNRNTDKRPDYDGRTVFYQTVGEKGTGRMVMERVHFNPQRVTEFCHDVIGEHLRVVAVIENDDMELLYVRESVADQYTEEKLSALIDATQQLGADFDDIYTYNTPLGQKEALVCVFEGAHVFLLPHSASRIVCIAVDPAVGENLSRFIKRCRDEIHQMDPPSAASAD